MPANANSFSRWTALCYGSQAISREVFFVSGALRKSQKTRGLRRETAFLPFLCIAQRVAGHEVNSNGALRDRAGRGRFTGG